MLSWSKEALQKRDIWHLKFLLEEDAVTLVCGDPWRTLPGKGGFRWPSLSGLYVLSNTQSKLNFSVFIYYFLMLNGKVFHDVKAIEKITVAHAVSGILWNTGGWFWLLSISYFSLYMHTSAYCVCLCGASPHISSVHLQCSQRTLKQKGVLVIMDQHFIDIRAEAWEGAPWPRSDGSVGQSWRYGLLIVPCCFMHIRTDMGNHSLSHKTQLLSPSSAETFLTLARALIWIQATLPICSMALNKFFYPHYLSVLSEK